MEIVLYVIGIIILIAGIVVGYSAEAFIITVISSTITAFVFFALGRIIGNQEIIMNQQQELLNNAILSRRSVEEKTCSECGKLYDVSAKSCPYCGARDDA